MLYEGTVSKVEVGPQDYYISIRDKHSDAPTFIISKSETPLSRAFYEAAEGKPVQIDLMPDNTIISARIDNKLALQR